MIDYWHIWLITAFVLLIIELMSGTYFLLALAGGAAITSFATWLQQPSLSIQLLYFALGSALSYGLLLSLKTKPANISDGTNHMIGQEVEVIESIAHHGRVRYKGVVWQAASNDDIPQGAFASIVAINGSTLTVQPIHSQQGEQT